jgi:hypothetical protein
VPAYQGHQGGLGLFFQNLDNVLKHHFSLPNGSTRGEVRWVNFHDGLWFLDLVFFCQASEFSHIHKHKHKKVEESHDWLLDLFTAYAFCMCLLLHGTCATLVLELFSPSLSLFFLQLVDVYKVSTCILCFDTTIAMM